MFKTIEYNSCAEIIEKKSKFIANAFYIESTSEAENYIQNINKKYFDSKHNCYAFSIYNENGIINRFSDNGEPSGTAGGPILNILNSKKITNTLIIVTRYFGGILLGTGGLVKAYSLATENALSKTNIIYKDLGLEAKFKISYSDFQKLQYYFSKNNIKILNNSFKENIEIIFEIQNEVFENILKNKENLSFKILDYQVLNKKYITIPKTSN